MKISGRTLILIILGFFATGLIWFSPVISEPEAVLFWRGGRFSDLLISHWPNAVFLNRAIRIWQEIPLWNPMILSGQPFVADPLSGIWYPPIWLGVIFPSSIMFTILYVLHLVWAGMGSFILARMRGISLVGSLFSGLAFFGSPKLLGHVGLGHMSLVFAVCWTPWLLVCIEKWSAAWAHNSSSKKYAALGGALIGLVFLTDPRWVLPLVLIGSIYLLLTIAHRHTFNQFLRSKKVVEIFIVIGFAIGISAGLSIPLAEFNGLSTRAGLTYDEQAYLSTSPDLLLGTVIPDFRLTPENQTYVGLSVSIFALWGFLQSPRRTSAWWVMVLVGWSISLGEHFVSHQFLNLFVPFAGSLRVPSRFLLVAATGLALASGHGLDKLLQRIRDADLGHLSRRNLILAFVLPIGGITGWFALQHIRGASQSIVFISLLVGFGVLGAIGLLITLGIARRLRVSRIQPLIIATIVIELSVFHTIQFESRPVVITAPLEPKPWNSPGSLDIKRVFSPSYSISQLEGSNGGIELADGVNPLMLQSYWEFMASATGFDPDGYSVTLPPYPSGSPFEGWDVDLDLEALSLLNVEYIVSQFPVEDEDLIEVPEQSTGHVYANPQVRPRAWIQDSLAESKPGAWREVERISWSPNRVRVEAEGPGFLVLSEIMYPGWIVEVNGSRVDLQVAYGVLRAAPLQEGAQEVVFTFRPVTVFLGLAITLVSTQTLIWLWRRR